MEFGIYYFGFLIIASSPIIILGLLIKNRNKKRKSLSDKIKTKFPNFREIDEGSLDKTMFFENEFYGFKLFTKPFNRRKYTKNFTYYIEISHFNIDEKIIIIEKIKSVLNIKPIVNPESIAIDLSALNDFDDLFNFLINDMHKRVD